MKREPVLYGWNSWGMSQERDGYWVTASAYRDLECEVERLERKVKEMERQMERSYDIYVTNRETT